VKLISDSHEKVISNENACVCVSNVFFFLAGMGGFGAVGLRGGLIVRCMWNADR